MSESSECGGPTKRRQNSATAPSVRKKTRQSQQKRSGTNRVCLEKVLGITTANSSSLTCDPNSGLLAYTAGCIIVLLQPKTNMQAHIINTSRKPFSAVAFSRDGKYLATGESGHLPCVRLWDVDGAQVAEVQSHKYGVACVAFSAAGDYIVSVGYQHDMTVSVWDWRKGLIVASNKVSSRVLAVAFGQDSSYFVTAGNRHVKFWYLEASKERRVNSTVPLIGRSGLLGDHKNSVFSGVACGRGPMASSTYCITSSGLLCLFTGSRTLTAWVDLKTASACCLAVSDDFIFCGCADGVVRVFSPFNLQYVTTLPRPHQLGVDVTWKVRPSLPPAVPCYPDTVALTFDPVGRCLTCVYNDHSMYVWEVGDTRNVKKVYSALYHSGCVWSLEMYPELSDPSQACLPLGSFFTCSSDNTIRLWHVDPPATHRNIYSSDLSRILYVGNNTQHLQTDADTAGADGKTGVRVLAVRPDGRQLVAGDRCGNIHVFSLQSMEELVNIEAHDAEVLCLDFSPISTGLKLLASASRDRLIHVFNLEKSCSLEQTLNDHNAAITAVKFAGESPTLRMVSCGADKSIYFRTAEQMDEGLAFCRSHHVVEKTMLYDMDLDACRDHVAVACQDRNVRVYNAESGKLLKCLKGSSTEEGALLKVQMDPSGMFLATSCSDKNITIFDYETGECVSTLFGHSELVTCMKFSPDCVHLVTVSGDSCVFVWRLDPQMTSSMRKRLDLRSLTRASKISKQAHIRRETFITLPSCQLPQVEEDEPRTPARLDSAHDVQLLQTNGKLPLWFRKLQAEGGATVQAAAEPRQLRGRWVEHQEPLIICSSFSPSPARNQEEEEQKKLHFNPQKLDNLLDEEEPEEEQGAEPEEEQEEELGEEPEEEQEALPSVAELSSDDYILYPPTNSTADGDFDVHGRVRCEEQELSPGSGVNLEQQQEADVDSLSQGSSTGSAVVEEEEEESSSLMTHFDTLALSLSDEKFEMDLRTLQPPDEKHFLNPRLSISSRFLSRFKDRIRSGGDWTRVAGGDGVFPRRAPPSVSIPSRISEDDISNTSVGLEPSEQVKQSEHGSSDITSRTLRANNCDMGPSIAKGAPIVPTSVQEDKENTSSLKDHPPAHLLPTGEEKLSNSTVDQKSRIIYSSQMPQQHPLVSVISSHQQPVCEEGRRSFGSGLSVTDPNEASAVSSTPPDRTTTCVTTSPSSRQDTGPGGIASSAPSHRDGAGGPVCVQRCQQLIKDLRQAASCSVWLYQQVAMAPSPAERHMTSLLEEALAAVHSELGAVLGAGHDSGMLALLEKYSDLLVQMTQKKLD